MTFFRVIFFSRVTAWQADPDFEHNGFVNA